jgi:hypothetical protein
MMMKLNMTHVLSLIAVAGAVAMAGCGKNSEAPGIGERTGAALDKAADKTAEAAQTTAETVKDVAGQAVEKTGAVLERAGDAVEKTGSGMEK